MNKNKFEISDLKKALKEEKDSRNKFKEIENQSLREEIDTLEDKLNTKNKEIDIHKDVMKNKDETINILKVTVNEVPRSQHDFARIKYMYFRAKKDLKECIDVLNQEILALRLSKSDLRTESTTEKNYAQCVNLNQLLNQA